MKWNISFSNVISNRQFNDGWCDIRENNRIKYLDMFKNFLLDTCKYNSKNYKAIKRMDMSNLPGNYGIFKRLIINDNTGKVEYIAGQDYPGEINYIKNIIKKEC